MSCLQIKKIQIFLICFTILFLLITLVRSLIFKVNIKWYRFCCYFLSFMLFLFVVLFYMSVIIASFLLSVYWFYFFFFSSIQSIASIVLCMVGLVSINFSIFLYIENFSESIISFPLNCGLSNTDWRDGFMFKGTFCSCR